MRPSTLLSALPEPPAGPSGELLELLLDAVADGVLVRSASGLAPNPAACRILGAAAGTELREDDLRAATLDGEPFDLRAARGPFRVRVSSCDGRELALEGTASPHALVFREVAPAPLQPQLLQSGKLAAIGELAAGVAHEINNPLFAILGLTEFLLKEAEPGSRARERLELIQQTGLEIKEIVRALLDFARESVDERHVVPLEDVVRSTVDLVRRTNAHKGIELVDSYDGSGACVYASPNQLKQVVLNLIGNARQEMPHGGTVTVEVRRDGDEVVATVADDGPGVAPELAERIFEPFFTTKRQSGGTGLGLSVGLGIAEAHGGSLALAPGPGGRGAVFSLRLPIVVAGQ